jgi:hypothetical protein
MEYLEDITGKLFQLCLIFESKVGQEHLKGTHSSLGQPPRLVWYSQNHSRTSYNHYFGMGAISHN